MILTIIGGGPAGYKAAILATEAGMTVHLIESHKLGGTCLHAGCIPTKALNSTAKLLKQLHECSEHGITASYSFSMPEITVRKDNVVNDLYEQLLTQLKRSNLFIHVGTAEIRSPHEVAVHETLIETDFIFIATGTSPNTLGFEATGSNQVHTTDTLFSLNERPDDLVIIGGGVIGVEIASIFKAFGSHVTILEAQKNLLPNEDLQISKRLQRAMKNQGIDMITQCQVTNISHVSQIVPKVHVQYTLQNSKDTPDALNASCVLIAVGRKPNLESLKLSNLLPLTLETSKSGIVVNDACQTTIPNIYAIGDINGQMLLAHKAYEDAHIAVHHILTGETFERRPMPSCIFSIPEISSVGKNEEQLKSEKTTYKAYRSLFSANSRAVTQGENDGFMKILVSDMDDILGVHIIGACATELIHEAALAMTYHLTFSQLKQNRHAHPTLSELYQSTT